MGREWELSFCLGTRPLKESREFSTTRLVSVSTDGNTVIFVGHTKPTKITDNFRRPGVEPIKNKLIFVRADGN